MNSLTDFRAEKDRFFASHPQSPLTLDQKVNFEGLKYFPENDALRLEVAVEEYSDSVPIEIQTTTGELRTYDRFGRFNFTVNGKEANLTIYDTDFGFFLPFVDALANTETYGAGRYLEPELLPNGKFLVDFNLAYNPYCAYNEPHSLAARSGREPKVWNCPLTPFENRLKVPIRAGERIPEGDWVDHQLSQEKAAK